jgi:hypothetical protein
MKILARLSFLFLLFFTACTNESTENKETTSENDVDAARNFIRAALDGNWNDARKFMLKDSTNTQLLDTYESNYQTNMNREDKRGYHEASITFYDTRQIDDSVSIISYSNSYKKQKDSLRVVRRNDAWLVDLKYSFPQTDTTHHAQ